MDIKVPMKMFPCSKSNVNSKFLERILNPLCDLFRKITKNGGTKTISFDRYFYPATSQAFGGVSFFAVHAAWAVKFSQKHPIECESVGHELRRSPSIWYREEGAHREGLVNEIM